MSSAPRLPQPANDDGSWASLAELLERSDITPQALWAWGQERLESLLTALRRPQGLIPPAPSVVMDGDGRGFACWAWEDAGLHLAWDGIGWSLTWLGCLAQQDWALPLRLPVRRLRKDTSIWRTLHGCWLHQGRFIPPSCLRDPWRLPEELIDELAEGLGQRKLFSEDFAEGEWWWEHHLHPALAAAMQVVLDRHGDARVLAVHQRLASLERLSESIPDLGPLEDPRFWAHPYLVDDVLRWDGAALILHGLIESDEPERHHILIEMGWLAACAYPLPAGGSLRRTLGRIRLPAWPRRVQASVLNLAALPLQRPVDGVPLLVALALGERARRGEPHPAAAMWLRASPATIAAALDRWHATIANPIRGELGLRMEWETIADCLDYPGTAASPMAFVRASLNWHRHHPHQRLGPLLGVLGCLEAPLPAPETALPQPPQLPFPCHTQARIRLLTTVADLMAEGAAMGHCLGRQVSVQRALAGNAYFLHVECDGATATVELDAQLRLRQARGPGNTHNQAVAWVEQALA